MALTSSYGAQAIGASNIKATKPVTIGESLDERIARARKEVEELCVTKAKLEALNVLDHPVDLYTRIIF